MEIKKRLLLQKLTGVFLLLVQCSLTACADPEQKPDEGQSNRVPSSASSSPNKSSSPTDSTNSASNASTTLGEAPSDPHTISLGDLRELLTQLGKRMDSLEAQVASMNDKLDSTRAVLDKTPGMKKAKTTAVVAPPSDSAGVSTSSATAPHDPEQGFVNDEAIQTFRKALILFQAQKYPEAILAFSVFLEKYPDHPLAGSAQFYVGESYMKQKEYKLAVQEFQRVLTSYDRSAHVSDTLSEMAIAEENIKKWQSAEIHHHLLSSLFPQSPAASTSNPTTPAAGSADSASPDTAVVKDKPESEENKTDSSSSDSSSSTDLSKAPPTAPLEDKEGASLQEQ